MKIGFDEDLSFSSDEKTLIQGKRQELQAMLRFINRTYIALMCRGRTEEAAELLGMYRGLGELDFSRFFNRDGCPAESEPDGELPDGGL